MPLFPLPVYTAADSPRLRYVLDWLLTERLGLKYELYPAGAEAGPGIAYGIHKDGSLAVPEEGLLQPGVRSGGGLRTDSWEEPVAGTTFSFDLFSAVFFLLSRMEEWGSTALDKHFRYPHSQSILHKKGWLQRPLVDEWCEALRLALNRQSGPRIPAPRPSFQASYDIDIAWSYRYKGLKRTLGGALRDGLKGRFGLISERLNVLRGGKTDPYDAFERLSGLHRRNGIRPLYFVLAALQPSDFDKNISPAHPAMQRLIRQLAAEGSAGLHPSYRSQDVPGRFKAEKEALEAICGETISISRQHFIRYWTDSTPRFLLEQGITEDYSMGYATANGFRAGTSQPFLWYDPEKEAVTPLRIHPFCFMDSTARFDLELSVEEAFDQLRGLRRRLFACGGRLVTVFHNFSLGNDPEWKGWWEAYARFVDETAAMLKAGPPAA